MSVTVDIPEPGYQNEVYAGRPVKPGDATEKGMSS